MDCTGQYFAHNMYVYMYMPCALRNTLSPMTACCCREISELHATVWKLVHRHTHVRVVQLSMCVLCSKAYMYAKTNLDSICIESLLDPQKSDPH